MYCREKVEQMKQQKWLIHFKIVVCVFFDEFIGPQCIFMLYIRKVELKKMNNGRIREQEVPKVM